MLYAIDSHHCSLLQFKSRGATRVLQIVDPEILNIVKVLLRLVQFSQISESIETFRKISGMLAKHVFFQRVFVLFSYWLNCSYREGVVDTCLRFVRLKEPHWVERWVLVKPDTHDSTVRDTCRNREGIEEFVTSY